MLPVVMPIRRIEQAERIGQIVLGNRGRSEASNSAVQVFYPPRRV